MKHALLAVLVLAGCGLPESEPDGIIRREALAGPAHVVQRPDRQPTIARAPSPGSLGLTLTNLPAKGHLVAVVGMLSCGFLEVGRGEADIVDGTVNVDITLQPQTSGENWTVFFFVDGDGDGKCTTETPLAAKLPALPAQHVQLDVNALPPSYGAACWAFNN